VVRDHEQVNGRPDRPSRRIQRIQRSPKQRGPIMGADQDFDAGVTGDRRF